MRGEFMDKYWWVISGLVGGLGGVWVAFTEGSWLLAVMSAVVAIAVVAYAQLKRENRELRRKLDNAKAE